MQKIVCVISTAFIVTYLIIGRGHWFSELARDAAISKRPLFSNQIDLSKTGEFVWEIPSGSWDYEEGEAHVSLVLDRIKGIPSNCYNRKNTPLRLRIDAYSKLRSGEQVNRLIKNWYYTTNEPFSPDARIWESYGGERIELGLGGITVYPYEKLHIKITVLTPDSQLAKAHPRILLIGAHSAVSEYIVQPKTISDVCLILCLILLLTLTVFAWK